MTGQRIEHMELH